MERALPIIGWLLTLAGLVLWGLNLARILPYHLGAVGWILIICGVISLTRGRVVRKKNIERELAFLERQWREGRLTEQEYRQLKLVLLEKDFGRF